MDSDFLNNAKVPSGSSLQNVLLLSVTARSRSGLWLQTTEDRERTRRQSEIPQILF